jgi:hypothetical protein
MSLASLNEQHKDNTNSTETLKFITVFTIEDGILQYDAET